MYNEISNEYLKHWFTFFSSKTNNLLCLCTELHTKTINNSVVCVHVDCNMKKIQLYLGI